MTEFALEYVTQTAHEGFSFIMGYLSQVCQPKTPLRVIMFMSDPFAIIINSIILYFLYGRYHVSRTMHMVMLFYMSLHLCGAALFMYTQGLETLSRQRRRLSTMSMEAHN